MPELDLYQKISRIGLYTISSPFGGVTLPDRRLEDVKLSHIIDSAISNQNLNGLVIPPSREKSLTVPKQSDTTIYFGILVRRGDPLLDEKAHASTREWMKSFDAHYAVQLKDGITEPLEPGNIVVNPRTGKGLLIEEGGNTQSINLLAPSA